LTQALGPSRVAAWPEEGGPEGGLPVKKLEKEGRPMAWRKERRAINQEEEGILRKAQVRATPE